MSHSQSEIYQLQPLSMGVLEPLVLETCLEFVCFLLLSISGTVYSLELIFLVVH